MRSQRGPATLLGLCAVLLTGCHPLPPPVPVEQLNPLQAQGYAEFNAHCGLCHEARVDASKNGPSLRGIFKKPYLPSGAPANDDRVTATILHGHGLMPPQNLAPDQIAAILAYLHTV